MNSSPEKSNPATGVNINVYTWNMPSPNPAHPGTELAAANQHPNLDVTMGDLMLKAGMPDNGETKDEQNIDLWAESSQCNPANSLAGQDPGRKYEVRSEIGRGGMGIVMEVEDLKLIRSVAMKVMLDPRTASKRRVLRFIEEARITSQLQHPGIMPIHELGVDRNGRVFYTMKHVTGRTLKEILKALREHDEETEAEYPLGRLLNILQRVCDAVAYAHAKGVIHRDLKPENIMVGDYGEVLVLDWGLAKVLKRKSGSSLHGGTYVSEIKLSDTRDGSMDAAAGVTETNNPQMVTMDGKAIGTPGYMAPEQARGQVSRMDEKSDIYSLGSILYHILALEPTIRPDKMTSKRQLLEIISKGRIKPLKESRRAPRALIAITMKALSLRPKDRYRTVKAFQSDLDAYLGGFATSADEWRFWKLITLFMLRHKVVSMLLMTMLVLLVAGLSMNYSERLEAERSEMAAVEKGNLAENALHNLESTAPAFASLSDAYLQRNETDDALKTISNAIELDPDRAEYHRKRGNILETTYRFQEALQEYEKVCQLTPDDNTAEVNLKLCRQMLKEVDNQKLFVSLRRQNRLQDALHIIMPLRKEPAVLKAILKKVLESEQIIYRSFLVDSQGGCSVELDYMSDISPWGAFPITSLTLRNCSRLSDLTPLTGMPLTHLHLAGTQVSDLSPLKDMPLVNLNLNETRVTDLSPLKGMPLTSLSLRKTAVSNLAPLADMPLANLHLDETQVADISALTGSPLTELDLSKTQVADLSPLRDVPLKTLRLDDTKVTDLSPLRGLPLTALSIKRTRVSDLAPLSDMQLTELDMGRTQVTDLCPLKDMLLTSLDAGRTPVADLSPLKGMPLAFLDFSWTQVTNLEPLTGMPLENIFIDQPLLIAGQDIVFGLKHLNTINNIPAADMQKKLNIK